MLQGQWRAPGATSSVTADMDAAAPTVAGTAALLLLPGGKGKTGHRYHPYPGKGTETRVEGQEERRIFNVNRMRKCLKMLTARFLKQY